ncbi:MAG: BON domain-containing protein [Thermoguttaceae bacterium]
MDRLSYGTMAVLPAEPDSRLGAPEPGSEADVLAAAIERAVGRETVGAVRGLRVEVHRSGIVLTGRCSSYYTKQKAQHAAMGFCGSGRQLTNRIEVV